MKFSQARQLLLVAILSLAGMGNIAHAAEQSGTMPRQSSKSLAGTWYSSDGAITFKSNGTVKYEGKRYYYAVTNGGLIQLSRKGGNRAISYQLSGGKLTLTVNGKARVYSRKRR